LMLSSKWVLALFINHAWNERLWEASRCWARHQKTKLFPTRYSQELAEEEGHED
jgi:protein-disulfide isomerase